MSRPKSSAPMRIEPMPHANLLVFRPLEITGAARAAELLGPSAQPVSPNGWRLGSAGHVTSPSVKAHVEWLLVRVADKQNALRQLRAEGFWVSIFFHDTQLPDADEFAAMDVLLTTLGMTLDFELEPSGTR